MILLLNYVLEVAKDIQLNNNNKLICISKGPRKAWQYFGQHMIRTERAGVDTPDSYSGGNRFESRPVNQLSWLKFSVVFLGPSTQILGQCTSIRLWSSQNKLYSWSSWDRTTKNRFRSTKSIQDTWYELWGSHGDDYEDYCLLGYNAA
jgi:hypothetical protein